MKRQYKILNTHKLLFSKIKNLKIKAVTSLFSKFDLCFVTKISDILNFTSF